MSTATYDLPNGWTEAHLSDLIVEEGVFVDGDWVESKDQDPDGDVRLIQLADVGDGVFRNRSSRYLTTAKARELRCTFLERGDILVARMPEPLARACIFPGDSGPCVTVVDVCVIRPGRNGVHPPWLQHFINAPQFRQSVEEFERGTTRKRISRANLGRLSMPVPPKEEQRRIATVIDLAQQRIRQARTHLVAADKKLTDFRQSVLRAACSGQLTADWRKENIEEESGRDLILRMAAATPHRNLRNTPEEPDLELPDTWAWAPIGNIASIRGGIQKQPHRTPKLNAYPYLRVANVHRNRLDLTELSQFELAPGELETYRLEYGDLLIVEGNGSYSEIGRASIWRNEVPNCVHQNHIIRVRFNELLPEFVNLFWNSPVGIEQVTATAVTTSGLYSLSTGKIASLMVPVPGKGEQAEIVRRVGALFAIADSVEERLAEATSRVERTTQAVLAKAFRGELTRAEAE